GHRWDTETPSKDDLFKDYTDQINRQMKYQANLSADDILTPHMTALMREDPVAYRIAKDRLADYAGLQSNFSKWQNNVADKMLAPAIGTNSASKLVSAIEQAVNDRVLQPRVVEDYVGASAAKLGDLKSALGSGKGFVDWIRALSEYLPAHSERLARTYAFTVGYGMARDFLKTSKGVGLGPDQIYQVAKQFTENTMYLYGTADKARIFTTPAGSAMGLFKNWMFHYIATMGEYAQQGFTKNN